LEALKTFTLLPCSSGDTYDKCEAYFNTSYDNFYLGGKYWTEFKILVDLLIGLNTTRPLREPLQRDLDKFTKSIRLLTVDLNIFGLLPVRIWAEFTKLEVLTIAFYSWSDVDDTFVLKSAKSPAFIKLRNRETRCGKRAELILKSASDSFDKLQRDMPQWNAPKIEVVARKTGGSLDEAEEDVSHHDDGPIPVVEGVLNENNNDDPVSDKEDDDDDETGPTPDDEEDGNDTEPEEDEEDDEYFLEQLPDVMSHQAWEGEIKRLKHKYHPSRKIAKRPYWMSDGYEDSMRARFPNYAVECPKGRIEERYGEILTDSEAESGGRETAIVWSEDEDSSY
jgi:hypothetical protein